MTSQSALVKYKKLGLANEDFEAKTAYEILSNRHNGGTVELIKFARYYNNNNYEFNNAVIRFFGRIIDKHYPFLPEEYWGYVMSGKKRISLKKLKSFCDLYNKTLNEYK